MFRNAHATRPDWAAMGLVSLAILAGCTPITPPIVPMEYDQVNNFRQYQFEQNLRIGVTSTENGMIGFYSGNPRVLGFWVTYVICGLDNQAAGAQPFNYDLGKFYVIYEGKRHYYKGLDPYTFATLPNFLSGPDATAAVNRQFADEILAGPATTVFPANFSNAVPLNYRFAIYVTKAPPGSPDYTGPTIDLSAPIPLRYDGAPNLLRSRNQPPIHDKVTPVKGDILPACRAQIPVGPV